MFSSLFSYEPTWQRSFASIQSLTTVFNSLQSMYWVSCGSWHTSDSRDVAFSQKWGYHFPSPFLPSTSNPSSSPFLSFTFPPLSFLSFRSRALNRARVLGECCKLPKQSPGHSPGHRRISVHFQLKMWPLVALKSVGAQYPPR